MEIVDCPSMAAKQHVNALEKDRSETVGSVQQNLFADLFAVEQREASKMRGGVQGERANHWLNV
jgi:hypothetical protein